MKKGNVAQTEYESADTSKQLFFSSTVSVAPFTILVPAFILFN